MMKGDDEVYEFSGIIGWMMKLIKGRDED